MAKADTATSARRHWRNVPLSERSAIMRRLRLCKAIRNAHASQLLTYHYRFMHLCKAYRNRILNRPLTALDKAYIRSKHSEYLSNPNATYPFRTPTV